MTTGGPPSGWYDDPSGQTASLRWWDGTAWTDDVHPKDAAAESGPGPEGQATVQISAVPPKAADAVQLPSPVTVPDNSVPVPGAAAVLPPVPAFPRAAPQSVIFETVDPNLTRRRILMGVGAAVLAAAMGTVGYLVGHTGKPAAVVTGPSADPLPSASRTGGDPSSPSGLMGTPIVGGVDIAGGRRLGDAPHRLSFMVPSGWQQQIDPGATGDIRYVTGPYACPGHGDGACQHGLVVENLRAIGGGWATPRDMVIGVGQVRVGNQLGLKNSSYPSPVKQLAFKIDGHDAYLALWHVPLLAGQATVPDSYCGVVTVVPTPGAPVLPTLQICVDNSPDAPPLAVMDQIADSIKLVPR